MTGVHDLWLFIASSLLLAITPGPDSLYIASRSVGLGARAGAVAALGVGTGIFVHTIAVVIGITSLLASSAQAFSILKLVGAAYLIYIGISLIRSSLNSAAKDNTPPARQIALRSIFTQGFLTNLLNPKVALFFVAFLPQFVDPSSATKGWALLFLGVLFSFIGTTWNLFVALTTSRLTKRLIHRRAIVRWFNRGVGAFLLLLGFRLIFNRHE